MCVCVCVCVCVLCANIISLPGRKNKRKSVLDLTKSVYYIYSNYKNIEQEMNKMAMHTHVIFRPRNAMLYLTNTGSEM